MAENLFTIVSEWMPNGNINEYMKAHPGANQLELVCFSFSLFLLDIDIQTITVARRHHQGVDIYA